MAAEVRRRRFTPPWSVEETLAGHPVAGGRVSDVDNDFSLMTAPRDVA